MALDPYTQADLNLSRQHKELKTLAKLIPIISYIPFADITQLRRLEFALAKQCLVNNDWVQHYKQQEARR